MTDGIEKIHPIIPASENKLSWFPKMAAALKNSEKTTAKCPGINGIRNLGWIMKMPHDVKLKVGKDWYEWETSAKNDYNAIEHHPQNLLYEHFSNWPENSCKEVIKIVTPWIAEIPEGYMLLQTHPAYLDDDRFTVLPGIYKREYGFAELTVPVIWNKFGDNLIKAGTPIAQFFLIKQEEHEYAVESIFNDEKTLKRFKTQNLILNSTYSRIYKSLRNLFD